MNLEGPDCDSDKRNISMDIRDTDQYSVAINQVMVVIAKFFEVMTST